MDSEESSLCASKTGQTKTSFSEVEPSTFSDPLTYLPVLRVGSMTFKSDPITFLIHPCNFTDQTMVNDLYAEVQFNKFSEQHKQKSMTFVL
jgi:hypothetical protein